MSEADDLDIFAAEHVLGLLEGSARIDAERRLQVDPAFAMRVRFWQERFVCALNGEAVEPPAGLWSRIEAFLPANDIGERRMVSGVWRAVALASLAVAAVLLLFAIPGSLPVPPQQPAAPHSLLAARLGQESEPAKLTISVDASNHMMVVTPVVLDKADKDAELWIIPEDGKPRSLGVIDATKPSRVVLTSDNAPHVHAGATFAVTLEPQGGSPTDGPTGPIVATGKISSI